MKLSAAVLALFGLVMCASPHQAAAQRSDLFMPHLVATSFVRALLEGRIDVALPLCAPRVRFEGRWVEGEKALRPALLRLMARARRARLKLRSLEIVKYSDMVKRFGKPPTRLTAGVKRSDAFALARFQRLGLVVGLERRGRLYRVKLLTD